ncbi:carbohydrate ABC transporter permease [Paenibacillus sp. FSL K6-0276]|uniref:carbohydrate ABC transporter permease n=1 Tax=unclassified Paenibacillus TaxID=185978 RepID=UPI0028A9B652|nr:carbohydrate ABC transporter permease [Paenibacillus sp.]
MKKRKRYLNITKEVFAWVLSLVILVPFLMVLLNSVKSVTEAATMSLALPTEIKFSNYVEVLKDKRIYTSFFNSLFLSTAASLITLIVSSMAAFVISRNRSRFNMVIYSIFLLGLVAPMNYVTTMKVMQILNIINTYTGVYLLYSAIFIPFTVFLYFGFIGSIPKELDEAAVIDGCKGGGLFYKIIFPLLKPVTVTAVIINFLNCWNDFVIPLYFLNSSGKWGMIMVMYNYFSTYISSWNLVSAAMILNLLPIIIVYAIGQKYIISGMTAGAVKG